MFCRPYLKAFFSSLPYC